MSTYYRKWRRPATAFSVWGLLLAYLLLTACGGQTGGDAHVRQGLIAFDDHDYHLAAHEFEQALKKGVSAYQPAEVHTVLGRAYEETGQPDKAILAYKTAIEIDPNYYKAWVNLGVAYRLTGNLEEAEKSYNQALSLEPNYAELHASLGALYIFKDEPQKALQSLSKAIELDPQLAVAHANIAVAYAMVNQFTLAQESLSRATVLGYPNSAIIKARIDALKALQN